MRTRAAAFAFSLAVLVQLWIPASMIVNSERTLVSGKAFKFRTAPVDPYDAFRGKYVALNFAAGRIELPAAPDSGKRAGALSGKMVYVILEEDRAGFAQSVGIRETPPAHGYYVKAKVNSIRGRNVDVEYPFTKFFLAEEKAQAAEDLYRKQNSAGKLDSYAVVKVNRSGHAVIADLVLGGIPLREALR